MADFLALLVLASLRVAKLQEAVVEVSAESVGILETEKQASGEKHSVVRPKPRLRREAMTIGVDDSFQHTRGRTKLQESSAAEDGQKLKGMGSMPMILLEHVKTSVDRLEDEDSSQVVSVATANASSQVPSFVRLNIRSSRSTSASLVEQGSVSPISGTYVLMPGKKVGGYPMWQQQDGSHWIFSGSNGRWIVGGSKEKQRGFECSDGILASMTEHHGIMPDRIGTSEWQPMRQLEQLHPFVLADKGSACPDGYASINDKAGCQAAYNSVRALSGAFLWDTNRIDDDMANHPKRSVGCFMWNPEAHVRESYFNFKQEGELDANSRRYCKLAHSSRAALLASAPTQDTKPERSCKPCNARSNPVRSLLGSAADKRVPDDKITASAGDAQESRLDQGGWNNGSETTINMGEFIQANFQRKMRVTHVVAEGNVQKFKLGLGWPVPVSSNTSYQVSTSEASTVTLESPFEEAYVRLFPIKFKEEQLTFRWDLLGCDCEPVAMDDTKMDNMCAACTENNPVVPLIGPSYLKALADNKLTASSYKDDSRASGHHEMQRARLDWMEGGSWVAKTKTSGQEWLEVKFPSKKRVTRVITRGGFDKPWWVKRYKVGESLEHSVELNGNSDAFDSVEHILFTPIESATVKLFPMKSKTEAAMRVELMGCECRKPQELMDQRGNPTSGGGLQDKCQRHLVGMGSMQRLIPDWNIVSSSTNHAAGCQAFNSHLHGDTALCFDQGPEEKWIQWDLGATRKIQGVLTQGSPTAEEWVAEYNLQGSIDGETWTDAGNFVGNLDTSGVKESRKMRPGLSARFVRLTTTEAMKSSLRVELIGCAEEWNLPNRLSLGELGTINFELRQPRLYDGRIFYLLDPDETDTDADMKSADDLRQFLVDQQQGLSENNNIIEFNGYRFNVPDAATLTLVLGGTESERGSPWPTAKQYLTSARIGQQYKFVLNMAAEKQIATKAPAEKALVGLELVRMKGEVEYDKSEGKCISTAFHRTPGKWADGSTRFARKGQLGGMLMCQAFCSQHQDECKGFIYQHSTGECHWLQGDFKTGDGQEAEEWTCYMSKAFLCGVTFNECGDGYAMKPDGSWCDGPCVRDTCCTPLGLCSTGVCGHAYKLKEEAPAFCKDNTCAVDECCTPRGTCSPQDCAKPAWIFKVGDRPGMCEDEKCTADECCEPALTCRSSECPAPFALTSQEPLFCKSQKACTMLECCAEVATCASVTCPLGAMEKGKDSLCSSMKCQEDECCDFKGSCKDAFAECPMGYTTKEDDAAAYCEDEKCTVSECCYNAAQCSADICTGRGWVLKNHSATTFCKDIVCTKDECCQPAGQCKNPGGQPAEYECPSTHRLRLGTEGRPEYCVGDECTVEECCVKQGKCIGNICPEGWNWKKINDQPGLCYDSICTKEECCQRLAECTADICPAAHRVKRSPPRYCVGPLCTEKECCSPLAKCSDAPDMCSFGMGLVDKLKPAAHCVDTYCSKEECCDFAGSCHQKVCPIGQVVTYDVYCKKADCTTEECCVTPPKSGKEKAEEEQEKEKKPAALLEEELISESDEVDEMDATATPEPTPKPKPRPKAKAGKGRKSAAVPMAGGSLLAVVMSLAVSCYPMIDV